MITALIGGNNVDFVLDTGSSDLAAKGPGCVWERCDGKGCESKTCPCGRDVYGNPKKSCDVYTGTGVAAGEYVVEYGSQTNTVRPFNDDLTLLMSDWSCDVPTPSHPKTQTIRYPVIIHQVTRIDGTSTSNLFGLARPPHRTSFLYAISHPVWSLTLFQRYGYFTQGRVLCYPPLGYTPLLSPSEFRNYATHFYLVGVDAILVGPHLDALTSVTPAPKYLLLDTGTTYTYMRTNVGKSMRASGFRCGRSYLQIVLQGGLRLTYTPHDLLDPYDTKQCILQFEDTFDLLFSENMNVCLFGVLQMIGMNWEFDINRHRLGLSPIT